MRRLLPLLVVAAIAPTAPASAAGGFCRVAYSGRPAIGNSPPGHVSLALRASGWEAHVKGSIVVTDAGRVTFRSLRLTSLICNDYYKSVDLFGIGISKGRRLAFDLKIDEAQMNVERHILIFKGEPGTKPPPLRFQHDHTTSFDGFVPYSDVSLSISTR